MRDNIFPTFSVKLIKSFDDNQKVVKTLEYDQLLLSERPKLHNRE